MKKIKHFYSLNPEWQYQFSEKIKAEVIDNKIIVIPEKLGTGHIYFTEVSSGISALFKDYWLTSTLTMSKVITQEEFYIFQYNLGNYEVSKKEKNLSIFTNQIEDTFEPVVNKRIFEFSLFIDKKVMQDFVKEVPHSEILYNKLINITGYNTDFIDSKSLLLLFDLKKKSIFDVSFDCYLKGISYKLLANFLDNNTPVMAK